MDHPLKARTNTLHHGGCSTAVLFRSTDVLFLFYSSNNLKQNKIKTTLIKIYRHRHTSPYIILIYTKEKNVFRNRTSHPIHSTLALPGNNTSLGVLLCFRSLVKSYRPIQRVIRGTHSEVAGKKSSKILGKALFWPFFGGEGLLSRHTTGPVCCSCCRFLLDEKKVGRKSQHHLGTGHHVAEHELKGTHLGGMSTRFRQGTERILQCVTDDILELYAERLLDAEDAEAARQRGYTFPMDPTVTGNGGTASGEVGSSRWGPEEAETWIGSEVGRAATPHSTPARMVLVGSTAGGRRSGRGSASRQAALILEQTLAPLEILYGRTFTSAIGIALHHAEDVVRFVEEPEKAPAEQNETSVNDEHHSSAEGGEQMGETNDEAAPCQDTEPSSLPQSFSPLCSVVEPVAGVRSRGPPMKEIPRSVFRVGDYTLFSAYFCPCSAYAYQSVRRQDFTCCKHLLALQLALKLEAKRDACDSGRLHRTHWELSAGEARRPAICVKHVTSEFYNTLLHEASWRRLQIKHLSYANLLLHFYLLVFLAAGVCLWCVNPNSVCLHDCYCHISYPFPVLLCWLFQPLTLGKVPLPLCCVCLIFIYLLLLLLLANMLRIRMGGYGGRTTLGMALASPNFFRGLSCVGPVLSLSGAARHTSTTEGRSMRVKEEEEGEVLRGVPVGYGGSHATRTILYKRRSSTRTTATPSDASSLSPSSSPSHLHSFSESKGTPNTPLPSSAMAQMPKLENFPDEMNFCKMEEEVLKMWTEKDAFKTSVKLSEGRKPFSFYDGPPFATGLPHYGHILAGTIKDMVCRFAYQTGHHVDPRFGWDCHGLPIEFEIDKTLGIKTSHDVLAYGIDNYNEECRRIVMRYAEEWEKTMTRMGRWIDFQNDYKTMHKTYMESVWWVFSQLWEKKLVYRGFRVMPYSTGCTTPLSNFEANSNYKDATDPSVTVAFQLVEDANTFVLAWTTTPWTLPSNLAVCVRNDIDYVKILDKKTGRHYYLAEARLKEVFPTKKAKKGEPPAEPSYTVLEKLKGEALVGKKYVPLFNYFYDQFKDTAYRVLCDDYVSTESGTGIVHQAPAFGEDDYRVCLAHGVVEKGGKIACPVDENGCFTSVVTDFAGRYVKEADADIMKHLEANKNLINKGSVVHSYPFCWRSETPLLYKAVDSWFVNVEAFRDKLLAANENTYWVPDFVKTRRFSNWLEDARDWNVSRNRYWGTPLPVWHSEDWEEVVCVGSIAELEKLSGVTGITDIHRHFVDDITIPSKRPGKPPLRRTTEVFDCWFESGSMPYGQEHYPFENKEKFEKRFPADFVAEGLDQTRGWFYTLLVLGVALFGSSPFKNVCVNGLILAEDGKKMSKRLKNYPDPAEVVARYGADALRMYIINSPVVRAEPLRFRDAGVQGILKDVLLPLFHACKFFITNTNLCIEAGGRVALDNVSTNEMDRWILASTQTLLRYVKKEMAQYHLYNVVPGILRFVVDLSNWYVRMNRRRMKNTVDVKDRAQALSTMLSSVFAVSRIVAHIAPFVAEMLYQRIKPLLPKEDQVDSVHYLMLPEVNNALDDPVLERSMSRMMTIVDLVRVLRDRLVIPMKRPVRQIVVVHPEQEYLDDVAKVIPYIKEEVNSFEVDLTHGQEYITTELDVNFEALGKKYRKEVPVIRKAVQALSAEEVEKFLFNKGGEVAGKTLGLDDVKVIRKFKEGITDYESNTNNDVVVLVNKNEDKELIDSWRAREFVNRIQQLRKKAKLNITDMIDIYFECEDEELTASIMNCKDQVNQTIKSLWTTMDKLPQGAKLIAEEDNAISDIPIRLVFTEAQL
eukprot:gene6739-4833_t